MIVVGGIAGEVNHAIKRPSMIVAGGIAGDVDHAIRQQRMIVAGGLARNIDQAIRQGSSSMIRPKEKKRSCRSRR